MGSDQQEDGMIVNVSAGVSRDSSPYQVGLNGPVIPDYSQNGGLTVLVEAKSKVTESLAATTNSLSSRRFSAEAQVNIKDRYRTREIQLEHVKSS